MRVVSSEAERGHRAARRCDRLDRREQQQACRARPRGPDKLQVLRFSALFEIELHFVSAYTSIFFCRTTGELFVVKNN